MNREKMLYHANAKGSLNFDVRSMKIETHQNLQFLLDGGYLVRNQDSIFEGGPDSIWQDFCITGDGKILLAIYRLEYAHQHERDTDKHKGRMKQLQEDLVRYNRNLSYFEPSLTKNQKKAVNYMDNNNPNSAASHVQKMKDVKDFQESQQEIKDLGLSPYKIAEHAIGTWDKKLDMIDLEELSLTSMFNMSVGLGPYNIDKTRHEDYVMKKCVEEAGELALEINISQGLSYKEPGKDGIKGEAVDLAICALDMFALQCNNMTPEEIEREFLSYMLTKLNKWRDSIR